MIEIETEADASGCRCGRGDSGGASSGAVVRRSVAERRSGLARETGGSGALWRSRGRDHSGSCAEGRRTDPGRRTGRDQNGVSCRSGKHCIAIRRASGTPTGFSCIRKILDAWRRQHRRIQGSATGSGGCAGHGGEQVSAGLLTPLHWPERSDSKKSATGGPCLAARGSSACGINDTPGSRSHAGGTGERRICFRYRSGAGGAARHTPTL